jgi:hypothetical protein
VPGAGGHGPVQPAGAGRWDQAAYAAGVVHVIVIDMAGGARMRRSRTCTSSGEVVVVRGRGGRRQPERESLGADGGRIGVERARGARLLCVRVRCVCVRAMGQPGVVWWAGTKGRDVGNA